jgi:hypothetical protein
MEGFCAGATRWKGKDEGEGIGDCVQSPARRERQSGSKVLECGLLGIANRYLWKMWLSQGYGTTESQV